MEDRRYCLQFKAASCSGSPVYSIFFCIPGIYSMVHSIMYHVSFCAAAGQHWNEKIVATFMCSKCRKWCTISRLIASMLLRVYWYATLVTGSLYNSWKIGCRIKEAGNVMIVNKPPPHDRHMTSLVPKLAGSDSCQAVSIVNNVNVCLCALCLPKYNLTIPIR